MTCVRCLLHWAAFKQIILTYTHTVNFYILWITPWVLMRQMASVCTGEVNRMGLRRVKLSLLCCICDYSWQLSKSWVWWFRVSGNCRIHTEQTSVLMCSNFCLFFRILSDLLWLFNTLLYNMSSNTERLTRSCKVSHLLSQELLWFHYYYDFFIKSVQTSSSHPELFEALAIWDLGHSCLLCLFVIQSCLQ